MKPLVRSVLGTFAISLSCTSTGIIVGMWMERDSRAPNIEAPCADLPLACAKRAAANRCGGQGRYRLLNEQATGHPSKFVFICVAAETI